MDKLFIYLCVLEKVLCILKKVFKIFLSFLLIIKVICYYNFKENVVIDIFFGIIIGILYILQVLVFGLFIFVKVENGFYIFVWLIILYVIFGIFLYVFMGMSVVICIVIVSVVDK